MTFSFRPLAGVNYNPHVDHPAPPPQRFRPLAGVNYNKKYQVIGGQYEPFPSPCGGEL